MLAETETLIIVVTLALAVLVSLFALRATAQRDKAERSLHGRWEPDERVVDADSGENRYFRKHKLLTPNELQAFYHLRNKLPAPLIICPQVRIADIIGVRWRKGQMAAFGRISQKHVDFIILDQVGALLFAVEVDDITHKRPDRQDRDKFVNAVFDSVGLPLIRVEPRRLESSSALNQIIARFRS